MATGALWETTFPRLSLSPSTLTTVEQVSETLDSSSDVMSGRFLKLLLAVKEGGLEATVDVSTNVIRLIQPKRNQLSGAGHHS
jgi:hypothetical protein